MLMVVSYDISNDGRREKVCNELKNYGEHIQYSVFECNLNSARIAEMQTRLAKFIHKTEDSIRYYSLCRICQDKIKVQGKKSPL